MIIEAVQFQDVGKDMALNFVQGDKYIDFATDGNPVLKIQTLKGIMTASLGDWIIKGVNGEYYPCKPDIFSKTYDPADKSIADNTIVLNHDWKFGSIQHDKTLKSWTVLSNNTNPICNRGNKEK